MCPTHIQKLTIHKIRSDERIIMLFGIELTVIIQIDNKSSIHPQTGKMLYLVVDYKNKNAKLNKYVHINAIFKTKIFTNK